MTRLKPSTQNQQAAEASVLCTENVIGSALLRNMLENSHFSPNSPEPLDQKFWVELRNGVGVGE